MSPRQLLRLFENRVPEAYDDQKTATEISNAEVTSQNFEQVITFILSQLKQILGTPNWNDAVPIDLTSVVPVAGTFEATCLATDSIGDCVYSTGPYVVTKCDPQNITTMPAKGMIISKSDSTTCLVQCQGIVSNIYGGLTPGETLFVDTDGGLTSTLPTPAPGDSYIAQGIGAAVDDDAFIIRPDVMLIRYKG